MRNVYGRDPLTGFASRPYDNVGVQYGLAALNAGTITTTQFLDLNEGIGGVDQDFNYTTSRAVGDAGDIKRAYQAGLTLSGGGGLKNIPVFAQGRTYNDNSAYHYQWFRFAIRDRMQQENGHADNVVMWRGSSVPYAEAWDALNAWVVAIKADTSGRPEHQKVVENRPRTLVDGCWISGQFVAEPQTLSSEPNTTWNTAYPSWTVPRVAAGGPIQGNILKCQLEPVSPMDYAVKFSSAEMARLSTIFQNGVCDWSKPGVNQMPVVPWASVGPSPVNRIFDVNNPY